MPNSVPITLVRHIPVVDATLDGHARAKFMFDTGAGLTVVNKRLLWQLGHSVKGPLHVGRRMSGQELAVPLTHLDSLAVGIHRQVNATVGAYNLRGVGSRGGAVGGMISLGFLENQAVTLDYRLQELVFESEDSLRERVRTGTQVPVEVRRQGPQVEMFLTIELPEGPEVQVEVDTGCDRLMLDEKWRRSLEVTRRTPGGGIRAALARLGRPTVHFGRLRGTVVAAGAPDVFQQDPDVAFTELIHDGVVGFDFLRGFPVTFDLRGSRMIFGSQDPGTLPVLSP